MWHAFPVNITCLYLSHQPLLPSNFSSEIFLAHGLLLTFYILGLELKSSLPFLQHNISSPTRFTENE